MQEREVWRLFFFRKLIEIFHRTVKKIKNQARYEIFNPFVTIGRTGTSNFKVKVMVVCLNISFMT